MQYLMFIAVCLIWGGNFLLMKWAGGAFGPISVAAGRVIGGAVVLWIVWLFADKSRRGSAYRLSRCDWLALMVPILIGSIYPYIMQPYLISKHQESAFFGMMVALVPLMTVAVSVPLLRIWPTARESGGVLLGLLCMTVLFYDGGLRGVSRWDLLLATLVPAAYSISNTFIKRRLSGMPSLFMTALILGCTGIVLGPVGAGAETIKPLDPETFWQALAALLWLGAIGTGLATVMFYYMVQTYGPLYAGMVTYVIPLGALAWGWFDNENVTATQLIALAGVLIAVAMVQIKPRKNPTI